jgi:hypothetical protein
MGKSLLFVTLMLALAACKDKSNNSPGIDFGPGDGFSYRDGSNYPTGVQDPTDWTTDVTWTEQEKALFPELSFNLNTGQPAGFIESNYLYPNPAQASTWGFSSRQTSAGMRPDFTVAAVVVGADYQIIQRLPHSTSNNGSFRASFDYAKLGMQPSTLYRLYYVLYNTTGLLYKGHGDIRYDKP